MARSVAVTIRGDRTASLSRAFTRATVRALNRALASTKTDATRRLAAEMGVTAKVVRDRLKLQKATPDRLEAVLRITGKRLPLLALAARETKAGVTYRGPGGGRKTLKHAFIATVRSGHVAVWKRRGRARLPISEKFGASLPYVAIKQKILQATRDVGQESFRKNLEHELARALGGN
jgi:hypothetical protein